MHSWDYWDSFGKLRKGLTSKDKFYSLINHAGSDKTMNILLTFGKVLIKDYYDLNLKSYVLLLACVSKALKKKIDKVFWNRTCSLFIYSWKYLRCNAKVYRR